MQRLEPPLKEAPQESCSFFNNECRIGERRACTKGQEQTCPQATAIKKHKAIKKGGFSGGE